MQAIKTPHGHTVQRLPRAVERHARRHAYVPAQDKETQVAAGDRPSRLVVGAQRDE